MTAEISGATVAPTQLAKSSNTNGRLRLQSDTSAPESGAVSFLSLLGSFGLAQSDGLAGQALASGAGSDDAAEPGRGGKALILAGAEPGLDSALMPALPAASLPIQVPADAPDSADLASSTGDLFGSRRPAAPGDAKLADPLARDAAAAGADGVNELAADATESPLGVPTRKGAAQLASGGADTGLSDSKIAGSPRDFMARVEAARVASEADTSAQQVRAAGGAGSGMAQTPIAAQADAETSGLRAYAARRPAERFGPRSGAAAAAAGATPGAESVSPGTSHGASPVYSPGAATPVPATAVAEKLHHWVSRGVQNAQLQLDAFGGGSVDVSISVKGQETIVDFRTDHAQARNLLLEAMPQLKEMLESEGLVFTGGFVGESGKGSAGSQRRDEGRQDGRDAAARTSHVKAAGAAPAGRLAGAAGASIDLFV